MLDKKVLAAIDAVRKVHGKASALRLTEAAIHSEVDEVIPTGIDALDWYGFQCGGLPVGRVSEVYSAEGMGKTSFIMQTLASCQAHGGIAVLVETEHSADKDRLETFGVDIDELVVFEPESLEQGFGQCGTFLEALPAGIGPVYIAWDSLAATMVEEELKEGPDGKPSTPGVMARVMSQRLKRLLPLLASKRAHLQFVNQTRQKIGVMFGNPETTPGGNALKFYASIRFRIGSGTKIGDKTSGDEIGRESKIKITKNRFGFPHREVSTRLIYTEGWDNDWTNLRLAKSWGLLPKNSSDATKAEEALNGVAWSPVTAANLVAKKDKET